MAHQRRGVRRLAAGTMAAAAMWFLAACPPPTDPTPPTTTSTTTTMTTTTVPAWIALGTCFDGLTGSQDFAYLGPDNTAGNVTGYASVDGTCSGGAVGTITVVRAVDQAAADALCAVLTPATPVGLNALGSGVPTAPAFPADAWQCWFAPV